MLPPRSLLLQMMPSCVFISYLLINDGSKLIRHGLDELLVLDAGLVACKWEGG
jgi:hypothetical protein